MFRYSGQYTSKLKTAFTVIGVLGIGLVLNPVNVPAFAQSVQVYEQNVPTSYPSPLIGGPVLTPTPVDGNIYPYGYVDPAIGLYPYNYNSRYYSYPINNFPPTVTYSYPNLGYYSYPGNSYYSYPSRYYPYPGNNYSHPNNYQRSGNGYYPGSSVQLYPSSTDMSRPGSRR